MKIYNLYFGRIKADGSLIEEHEFFTFLGKVVTPLFSGYTLIPGLGCWNGELEQCTILQLANSNNPKITLQQLSDISSEYCKQFENEKVLVVASDCIIFLYGDKQ